MAISQSIERGEERRGEPGIWKPASPPKEWSLAEGSRMQYDAAGYANNRQRPSPSSSVSKRTRRPSPASLLILLRKACQLTRQKKHATGVLLFQPHPPPLPPPTSAIERSAPLHTIKKQQRKTPGAQQRRWQLYIYYMRI